MIHSVPDLWDIAHESRAAFDACAITEEMIVDAYGGVYPSRIPRGGGRAALLTEVEWRLSTFPSQNCEYTSMWLGKIVGYGQLCPGFFTGSPHKVWDVGATALGETTIMDITADQFGGPAVYVGPLVMPWEAQD